MDIYAVREFSVQASVPEGAGSDIAEQVLSSLSEHSDLDVRCVVSSGSLVIRGREIGPGEVIAIEHGGLGVLSRKGRYVDISRIMREALADADIVPALEGIRYQTFGEDDDPDDGMESAL